MEKKKKSRDRHRGHYEEGGSAAPRERERERVCITTLESGLFSSFRLHELWTSV